MEPLFWFGVAALSYTYLAYPVLLLIFRKRQKDPRGQADQADLPEIAVLVSAYNERQVIPAKISNFRELAYPPDRLVLWIGSDGSRDGTAAVARSPGDPPVRVLDLPRSGKTAVLNVLAEQTDAEILIFTDVNAMFRKNALHALVAPFKNPRVGLVSGRTVSRGSDAEGLYSRYERWLKSAESDFGCLTGADGAIYAMRRSLYRRLDPSLINDLTHPCSAVLEGYDAVLATDAICEEESDENLGREFARQTRMAVQGMRVYCHFLVPLLAARKLAFAWMLTSHKLCRWLSFVWMICVAAGTAVVFYTTTWGFAALLLQLVFYAAAGLAALLPPDKTPSILRIPLFFCVVNAAYLKGIARFLAGQRLATWESRGS